MTKAELRAEARRRLRALGAQAKAAAEAEIGRRVWEVPEVAAARTLLLFADLPEEVSTDAIAAEAMRRGLTVVYPRTVPDTRGMTLHRVASLDHLRTGSYGIREPDVERCPEVAEASIDVALVPGLAWDRRGSRLGRGAGYYDRLFGNAAWRGFRCGIFFSLQEVESVPAEPWDLPLNGVVTEQEVWRVGGGG
ncbi:MAG TPA: 5-formyltetrahydrofolate cyclo-ligase [Longimicrobium sp.]|jgi:5-formyltetrahydrofolate cyclo-ligase|nr:5-formyltetrahydrofolate cyclo-ligase [Longimicrobium sp.]